MASLKKRKGNYSIVFKTSFNGKTVMRTFSLGTKLKKIAEQKKVEYEKLYDNGEIDPFHPTWNLRDYENGKYSISVNLQDKIYLGELKEEFLNARTDIAEKTKSTYNSVLDHFSKHVGETLPVIQIRENDIRSYCLNPKLAVASQRNYHRHLKAFFNWLVEEKVLEQNPCLGIRMPKAKENLVNKIINEEELNQLFRSFRKDQLKLQKTGKLNTPVQKKLWFKPLITLAFYTGLRRKEILQLQWSHIELEDRLLRVTDTKNGEERTVPIVDVLYHRLRAWKKLMEDPENGLVFPHPNSRNDHQFPLTEDHASKMFKKHAKKAGFKNTINFHGLRHSCATFLLRKGFNVIEVKNMLGHKSIEVTNKYVHLVANDLLATAQRSGLIAR